MEVLRAQSRCAPTDRRSADVVEVDLEALGARRGRGRGRRIGICHSDLSVQRGVVRVPLPVVPGHEGAGIITRVGTQVTEIAEGDHVVLSWVPSCGTCYWCNARRGISLRRRSASSRCRPTARRQQPNPPCGRGDQSDVGAGHVGRAGRRAGSVGGANRPERSARTGCAGGLWRPDGGRRRDADRVDLPRRHDRRLRLRRRRAQRHPGRPDSPAPSRSSPSTPTRRSWRLPSGSVPPPPSTPANTTPSRRCAG